MAKNGKEPHRFVLELVQESWSNEHSKNFWHKLSSFFFIKPTAIEIIQTNNVNNSFKHCTGATLQRWLYSDEGLKIIPLNAETTDRTVNYCWYCIDEKKKQLAVVWSNIFSGSFKGTKIRRGLHGTVYEIITSNCMENYEPINVWIE